MSRVLETLEPKAVFHFFEDLTRIPHGSRNTKAISDYCVAFAKERGLWVYQDALNNVIIKKPATAGCEAAPPSFYRAISTWLRKKRRKAPSTSQRTRSTCASRATMSRRTARRSAATTALPSPWRWPCWTAAKLRTRRLRSCLPSTRRSAWRARRALIFRSSPPAVC